MKQQFLELIDRKIELLSHKNNSTFGKSTLYECIIGLCKELRQEVEKMEEWIPVTEMPKKDGMYIVAQKDPYSKSIAITNCIFNKQLGWTYEHITHWLPLTNPPTI